MCDSFNRIRPFLRSERVSGFYSIVEMCVFCLLADLLDFLKPPCLLFTMFLPLAEVGMVWFSWTFCFPVLICSYLFPFFSYSPIMGRRSRHCYSLSTFASCTKIMMVSFRRYILNLNHMHSHTLWPICKCYFKTMPLTLLHDLVSYSHFY